MMKFFIITVAISICLLLIPLFPFHLAQSLIEQKITPLTHHLVVLVPGFLSPQWARNIWVNGLANDEIYVYSATSGYGLNNTSRSLEEQGENLAHEINLFVQNSSASFTHISFIGISLGGVVSQYALDKLNRNYTYHAFISLNSPHHGVPQRKTWFWKTLSKYFDAMPLYRKMTSNIYSPHQLDNINSAFPLVILVATEYDTTVSRKSALADGYEFNNKKMYSIFLASENLLDRWINLFAHSFATMRPKLVYKLRQALNIRNLKTFEW